ncbi:keratin, type II cytoskeletal 2 epidermal [Canna indica]|uniref:Keratin, type II cytoskeletal 2 epidermal n=1 Tax=Canna indica TaxID=4628 RepID=A0AAQ3QQ70_9LILI|nr:keratin, type II cytoskeletal 2 epidermal [Canna indica]
MEEDSVDASESFISLSSLLNPQKQQPNGEQKNEVEETMVNDKGAATAAEDSRGVAEEEIAEQIKNDLDEQGEEKSGGLISNLISSLAIPIPGFSAEESEDDDGKKEGEDDSSSSNNAGLIKQVLPIFSDEPSPTADEASLLISIIED